jgi:hypothetical protein
MKRVTALIMAMGIVVSLSSCATKDVGQITQSPTDVAIRSPASANPSQASGGKSLTGASAAPQTNSPAGRPVRGSFLTHAADVVVYGTTRIQASEGNSFRDIVKSRSASGYYDDAMSRAFYFQPEVSFDQDQINILQTFLR